jgi:hypothetical protein
VRRRGAVRATRVRLEAFAGREIEAKIATGDLAAAE